MKIEQTAVAGTLESSDVQVTISKNSDGIAIELDSQVVKQYGPQIKALVAEILASYDITDAKLKLVDKGALDCTIKARTVAAINRSLGHAHQDINWEVL